MKKMIVVNFLTILYLEFMFQLLLINIYTFDSIMSRILYSLFISLLITFIVSLFKGKASNIINYLIYILLSFWFSLDAVFYLSIKSFFSLSLFKLTDQAVGFIGETFFFILRYSFIIVIFFSPVILYSIFRKKINYNIVRNNKNYIMLLILVFSSFLGFNSYLYIGKDPLISNYNLYYNIDNVNLSTEKLGVLPSIHSTLFKVKDKYINTSNNNEIYVSGDNTNTLNISYDENINKDIKHYIDNNNGTNKNDYTGFFSGKSVIFVTAESFSDIAVNKDLTPTLYKLTHNSFVFNNYYNPYYLSTVAGEFQILTSLYPDVSTLDNWKKGTNSFPYGIGTMFKNNGYNTYAYHAHDGTFQNRNIYMKSIGFDNFKACNMGLNINCNIWPESDIDMINSTYNDYINSDKPFFAYYMTVSGHMNYDFNTNDIAIKNKMLVDNLQYSNKVKAYLATQIELDRALELLINKLEENNKLDDTVIVLTADHYPYQLNNKEINEISTYKKDDLFEVNHSNLVIYNSKMETKYIDKLAMAVDVVPTMYNLLGFNYDSRLYIGNDIFSDSEGLVIFNNLSWINDKGKYNTLTGESNLSNKEINKINRDVLNRISFSRNIINYNGYKYIKIEE